MKLAVIGRGLIGSGAARHLSAAGYDVTLIGPSEPGDFTAHSGTFGSHYDEGRITRGLDPRPFWSKVSRASIARYRAIESQSGVRFYSEVGVLMTGPQGHRMIEEVARVAQETGIACDRLDHADLARRFPYFAFPPDRFGVFEPQNAGYISPRSLVKAQGICVQKNGGKILDRVVTGLEDRGGQVAVATAEGPLRFDRVLIATGGFSKALLGEEHRLKVCARTVALFRLEAEELARLAGMPSHIDLTEDELDPYLLPPIRYPDGHSWIKLGGDPVDIEVGSTEEVNAWFRSGGSVEVGDFLQELICRKIPGLEFAERQIKPCVTSYTKDDMPDIRSLSDRIAIAVGGNGRAAKNSDELGRLGAELLVGPLPG